MESTNDRPTVPFNGRREMQALALGALDALERAGLIDEIRLLHERVLTRTPAELMDRVGTDGQVEHWTFKPIVELLLREAQAIANRTDRPLEERRHEFAWLLDTAGF